ncbi:MULTISPECIES: metallophosphoesterase family protein [Pseudothermotoga]|jgi:serine/threonine protein phosphatase 1|uniref:Bis(5'nucleosyl)-tetraphosphatase, ApaH n=1 Tax=Pseudothermotoga lettingae (strain ATCC BAA-301 / DSM 14385 / NBRC 107922 / TMO) TaxID=416591 RepID=A8F4E0_PSELT|nr:MULTISPECIES: metallophosphoesterase family protein [Pseudothermotoga]ABV33024.1 bis(5'nucleosyl)-tetraphosphatase, ApaH [Pseudothermotoga lettingae TMO]GLI47974.1 serine/threonine protein phosphatase [Pseudothermotoga lettingae TMO]
MLLNLLPLEKSDRLIFLGDYVDRGPDSKLVLNKLISLRDVYDCVFLRGNHEWMMLNYLDEGRDFELWSINGAMATIRSYGGIEKIPREHIEFLHSTVFYHVETDFVFVHAGVRPSIPLEKQSYFDLVWIRDEFIFCDEPLKDYTVVFGHTPFEKVFFGKNKIGIDTGCVYGGNLTAMRLYDRKIFQIKCGDLR